MLGYSCDGREGEQRRDPFGGQPIVCTTVRGKRGDMQVRWDLDEGRMTATSAEVDEALDIAVASATRLVTGEEPSGFVPNLRSACTDLERSAQRAEGQSDRLAAARFCLSELDSIAASRPAIEVNPGILQRLKSAR
jgi:hypothetical protein